MKVNTILTALVGALSIADVDAWSPPPFRVGKLGPLEQVPRQGGKMWCIYSAYNANTTNAQVMLHNLRTTVAKNSTFNCSPGTPGDIHNCVSIMKPYDGIIMENCGGVYSCDRVIKGLQDVINMCKWDGTVQGLWQTAKDVESGTAWYRFGHKN